MARNTVHEGMPALSVLLALRSLQDLRYIDLRDIFPADESNWNQDKLNTWSWDTYLTSAEKLTRLDIQSACRWAKPATP